MSQNNGSPVDPWGGGNKSPPDLDRIFAQRRICRLKNISSGESPSVFFILLTIFFFRVLSRIAFYKISSDLISVVQHLGKYINDMLQGLHCKLPFWVDSSKNVPGTRQFTQQFWFATPSATAPYQSLREHEGRRETQMLTRDLSPTIDHDRSDTSLTLKTEESDPAKQSGKT